MPANDQHERCLRKCEAILDAHHTSLPAWSMRHDEVAYVLLTIPDGIHVLSWTGLACAPGNAAASQRETTMVDGVAQGIRWLSAGKPHTIVTPTSDDTTTSAAHDYADWASNYANLADFHTMYGRGQIGLETTEVPPSVKFVPVAGPGHPAMLMWHDEVQDQTVLGYEYAEKMEEKTKQAMRNASRLAPHRLQDGHIVLDEVTTEAVDALRGCVNYAFDLEPEKGTA